MRQLTVCVLCITGFAITIKAIGADEQPSKEPPALFRHVDTSTMELTPSQAKVLAKLKNERTAADVQIVKLAPAAFQAESMQLNFADGTTVNARVRNRTDRTSNSFVWSGHILCADQSLPEQSAHFAVHDSSGTGSFSTNSGTYNLRPLGNGLHALIKRDPAKLKDEEPPEAIKKVQEEGAKKDKPVPNPMAESPSLVKVAVMVVFTPAVSENHADISSFIKSVVDITNACYKASNVPIELNLVHSAEVAFVESGSVADDVDRLSSKNDGVIDDIHSLRDQQKADIVVMLIDNGDAYGMADAILADASTAFAVVDDEVADWYFTFAHEVGHLFGCRHNPEADPSTAPFPYGHCLCNGTKQWRTIMSYDCTGQSTRIGIFSSPLLKHPPTSGDPAGSSSNHDNCRVLRETATTISAFR